MPNIQAKNKIAYKKDTFLKMRENTTYGKREDFDTISNFRAKRGNNKNPYTRQLIRAVLSCVSSGTMPSFACEAK